MTFISRLKTDDEPARLAALQRYHILDTTPENEFDDITALVRQVLNTPIAAISLIDSNRQWFKSISGINAVETPRAIAFCDHAIRGSHPMKVNDTTEDQRFVQNPFVTGPPGLRCYLGAPLKSPDGYNIGTLCVMGSEAREFSEMDAQVLESFAKLVVSQLELRLASGTDALTGTLTRAAFEAKLRAVFKEPQGRPMALLLADIDLFKNTNDQFGHKAGDSALRVVSRVMIENTRNIDVVARYGGEEFAILLMGTEADDAFTLTDRLRAAVSEARIPAIEAHKVTISIGIAQYIPSLHSVEDWLERADQALYQAKSEGRNKVVVFDHKSLGAE